jgi:hypothetical protein
VPAKTTNTAMIVTSRDMRIEGSIHNVRPPGRHLKASAAHTDPRRRGSGWRDVTRKGAMLVSLLVNEEVARRFAKYDATACTW